MKFRFNPARARFVQTLIIRGPKLGNPGFGIETENS